MGRKAELHEFSQIVLMMTKINLLKARLFQTSHIFDCSYPNIHYNGHYKIER